MTGRGSVTVFLALVLSLLVSLVAGCLASVQMACARVQVINATDVGLYSLFAQYDTCMLEEYNLFYLDAGYGEGKLNLSHAYDTALSYTKPILQQNSQNLALTSGGITGFRLATDNDGQSFRAQAVSSVRETLGVETVQALLSMVTGGSEQIDDQQNTLEEVQANNNYEAYDQAMAQQQEGGDGEEGQEEKPAEPVDNPIDIIRKVQEMGILQLVLTDPSNLSSKTADLSTLASHRQLQTGFGIYEGEPPSDSVTDDLLFQEYLLKHLGNYRKPANDGLLSYSMEYIIGKTDSDTENLKAVANRLLLIREGINLVYLLSDGVKRSEATALATAISAGIPVVAGIIEMLLLTCWAYGESILDVRGLLDGCKVPLMKNAQTWQLELSQLSHILTNLDAARKNDDKGVSYEDYLRILLFMEKEDSKTMKCLDAFELTVRGREGHEQFQMDACVDAMELTFDVSANHRKTFRITRQYCYR